MFLFIDVFAHMRLKSSYGEKLLVDKDPNGVVKPLTELNGHMLKSAP